MYGSDSGRTAGHAGRDPDAGLVQGRARARLAAGRARPRDGREVLNFCANNYLGLADHPAIVAAAQGGARRVGLRHGAASGSSAARRPSTWSSRRRLSQFLRHRGTILFSSCFDANGGVFEVLLDDRDAVISDELNHASIIDGIRLCKATRLRYRNRDMADLEAQLGSRTAARRRADRHRRRVLDGRLPGAAGRDLRPGRALRRAGAWSTTRTPSASSGRRARGTPELFGVQDRVDIVTGTLGKALGGASGGYVSARAEIVELLRQRSRPYLFSNAVAPSVVAGSLAALDLVAGSDEQRAAAASQHRAVPEPDDRRRFRRTARRAPDHPGDVRRRGARPPVADAMLDEGVYVIAFSYPVVPKGKARIRVQLSAAHTEQDVETCVHAFVAARSAS